MPGEWRPTASLETLRIRAAILARVRAFFAGCSVLEVETPMLCRGGLGEPHILALRITLAGGRHRYLPPSPEPAMKRLLCAGSGPIYQIARVFRDGEEGRLHNPEFTLIEWYRPGFDHHALMDEVEALVSALLGSEPFERIRYGRAFEDALGLDPHAAGVGALAACARGLGLVVAAEGLDRGTYLDFLLSHAVTPRLGHDRPCFLFDFPEPQAAFARVRVGTPPVAERFELFIQGIEIANGCRELGDGAEQRRRLLREEARRRALGLPTVPLDEPFLAALESGLPDCAGCALGLDRLLMVATGVGAIQEVLAFPPDRA
ncbi:MAG: EF-P lysine aminoacylase EpmA [Gammaproteobacteria bacterium]